MTKKITEREMLEAIKGMLENKEVEVEIAQMIEFVDKKLGQLDRTKAKAAERRENKRMEKAEKLDELESAIVDALKTASPMGVTQIAATVPSSFEASASKVVSRLTTLREKGVVDFGPNVDNKKTYVLVA